MPRRRSARLAEMAPQLYVDENYDDARDRFDDIDEYKPDADDTTTEGSPDHSPDSHGVSPTPTRQPVKPSLHRSHQRRRDLASATTAVLSRPNADVNVQKPRTVSMLRLSHLTSQLLNFFHWNVVTSSILFIVCAGSVCKVGTSFSAADHKECWLWGFIEVMPAWLGCVRR